MKTFRGIMFLAVVVGWVLMPFSTMAGDPGKDVNIVNTKSNPVPVAGNIGITGTTNVNLTNFEKNPLPINLVKETLPFSISSYCNVHSGNTACEIRDDLKVPSGMRAVILFAQCHVEAIHNAPETLGLCTIQDVTTPLPDPPSPGWGFRAVPTLFLSPSPGHFGIASLSTHMVFTGKSLATGRIYPKPDVTIPLSTIWFTLSGYFEPN